MALAAAAAIAAAVAAAYCCWIDENRCGPPTPAVHAPGNWEVLLFSEPLPGGDRLEHSLTLIEADDC